MAVIELHAWIATYFDGTEGLMAGSLDMPEGPANITMLVANRRELAQRMELLAKRTQYSASRPGKRIVGIQLVTFRREERLRL